MKTKAHRQWLLQLMEAHGFNRKTWAEKAKVNPNILYNYFKGYSNSIDEPAREKLAPLIGLTPDEMKRGTDAPQAANVNQSFTKKAYDDMIPVYGPVAGARDGLILFTEEHIVSQEPRPDSLQHVRNGFRMHVSGDSMEPRHYHGELVSVNPNQFPILGQDCVIVQEPEGNALIKRYMGKDDKHFHFEQYNPPKKLKIKAADVRAIYSVVR